MRLSVMRYFLIGIGVFFVRPIHAGDAERAGLQLFESTVRPALVEHCYSCHSAKKTRGGLALDTREGLRKGGVSGPSFVPGKADESLLVRSIRHVDPDLKMPQKAPKLDDAVIAAFVRWVNLGAPDPRGQEVKVDARSLDWWSLKPLVRPAIPKIEGVHAGWGRTPIDAFLLAKLAEKKLAPSKEAEPRVLIRRLTFDLIGLPPTPEETEAFVAAWNASPATQQKTLEGLVDRLLASPHYGERWARHWLDVVHYGESNGFGMDRPRFKAWPYRDYVIQAFNADKPYARFVQEQIAADVLFPNEPELIPALGFAAAGPFNQSALVEQVDGTDCRRIALNLDRDDMVTSVGTTFLSMTVQCARCHEHKFDPISQRDYYRLQAVFAGVGRAERPFESDPRAAAQRRELTRRKTLLTQDPAADPFSADEKNALQAAQAEWEAKALDADGGWQKLTKLELAADSGTTFTALPDGSYLCGGPRPERDTYHIAGRVPLTKITAVRLEVLPHETLPKQGPGRQDNGNLHLSEFKVRAAAAKDLKTLIEVPLHQPSADFNQAGWDITRAIDGKKETAWGIFPEVGKPHYAIFEFKKPVELGTDTLLTFQLDQLHGEGHLIGRLRLSATGRTQPAKSALLPKEVLADVKIPAEKRTPEQAQRVARHFRLVHLDEQIAALPKPGQVWAIASDFPTYRNYKATKEPLPIHVLRRGDIKQPVDLVGPGGLECVESLPAVFAVESLTDEGERRAALAKWLTHSENMLAWRSVVNRVWHYHFGRGIVDSPNDLGRMGSLPTHLELLDWLAVEFRDGGGSLKKLHRLIVTSAAYRQVSDHDPARAAIDTDNRYLWRMNRSRLDAETLRDAILAVTGKLDRTQGGPSAMQFDFRDPNKEVSPLVNYDKFDPDSPTSFRRGVYRFVIRNINDPLLDTFDAVDPSQSVGKRNVTITPLQALSLMNNRFVLRQCEHLATRLEKEGESLSARIDRACRLTLGRPPNDSETRLMTDYAERHGLANLARVLLNCNDFVFVP